LPHQLLFIVRSVFLFEGKGTALIPDRFPFNEKLTIGDCVELRGAGKENLQTAVLDIIAPDGFPPPLMDEAFLVNVFLPAGIFEKVRAGLEVWLVQNGPSRR
jgi:hypothetical protein